MAASASASNPKTSYHARSNSLPSRTHPLVSEFNENMCRLTAHEGTSSSSISHKLNGLQDLYDCVDKLLLLPLTQNALAQTQHEKWADELLDGSLRLLDVCGIVKDALLQAKECAHQLQSVMRRRRGGETAIASEVKEYLTSRKVVKKAFHKALGTLKAVETRSALSPFNKDNETVTMVSLRELEAVTVTVFNSLMSFIFSPKVQSKSRGWSLVSNLMHTKRIECEEGTDTNEFAGLDAALQPLISNKTSKSDDIFKNAQNQLERLESSTQDLEEGLECLFRRLIKTRVSLLNILNH